MASLKRLLQDVDELKAQIQIGGVLSNLVPKSDDLFTWTLDLCPSSRPYNSLTFKLQLQFPIDYPFKPPKAIFLSEMYHPNINEGLGALMDMDIVCPSTSCWAPSMTLVEFVGAVVSVLEQPTERHLLRDKIWTEYQEDKELYFKNAEKFYQDKQNSPKCPN